jgi:hypothetical protein
MAGKRPYLVVKHGVFRKTWNTSKKSAKEGFNGWLCIPTGGITYLIVRKPTCRVVFAASNQQCQSKFRGWNCFKLMP